MKVQYSRKIIIRENELKSYLQSILAKVEPVYAKEVEAMIRQLLESNTNEHLSKNTKRSNQRN